jgi:hypothetical protein
MDYDLRAGLDIPYLRHALNPILRNAESHRRQYFLSYDRHPLQDSRANFSKDHGHILARSHYDGQSRAHAGSTYFLSPFGNTPEDAFNTLVATPLKFPVLGSYVAYQ